MWPGSAHRVIYPCTKIKMPRFHGCPAADKEIDVEDVEVMFTRCNVSVMSTETHSCIRTRSVDVRLQSMIEELIEEDEGG